MKVSVVVPNRDMGRFLPDAFASIERQRIPVAQVILADAGSTDESLEVAEKWQARGLPLEVTEVPGANPARARNAALERVSGDVVAFLDADDLFPPTKLAVQLARLEREPRVELVSGFVTLFETLDADTLEPAPGTRMETLAGVWMGACIFRRGAFERIGRFEESLLYSEDTDFLLRCMEAGLPAATLRWEVLYHRRHPDSMMSQPDPKKQLDFHRALARSIKRRKDLGLEGDLPTLADLQEPVPARDREWP